VRENREGTLYTLVYGVLVAQHVDPIEKKPLFHFHPGSKAYSIAAPGCNFRCQWCQNASISQMPRQGDFHATRDVAPEEVVAAAQRAGCKSVAYTYTEPTIFFEFAHDTALLAHEEDLANVFVTNGFMTEDMLAVEPLGLDAANVDLKAFRDETYRQYVGARLQPVLDSMKQMKDLGVWLEVTTLIIPDLNDDPAELRDAAQFIARELGPETPWHISRFFPAYQMQDVPPTPSATVERARDIGYAEGLHHIYAGNLPGEQSTVCAACDEVLIRRSGYRIVARNVGAGGRCPACDTPVAGVGMGA
jgi:pyruvate formate lyase activating enzyme